MTDNLSSKSSSNYCCKICDYTTSRKSQYDRHNLSSKHIILHNKLTNITENVTENLQICTCTCGKSYKHRQSLFTHKKKCSILNLLTEEIEEESASIKELKQKEKEGTTLKMTDIENAIPNMDMSLIFAFMKDTQEFKQIILEQSKIMAELVEKVGNTTNINTQNNQNNQNNQFNLNFFLNDTCKGAMNVKDFMNFINVDLEDIEYIGKHGYVAGISRIFTKNLARLGKFEKPIWVTDEKRETIMYKEDGVWNKDDDHIKMNKISVAIEFKCIKALTIWRELNPDWREDEKKGEFLNIMNGCVFGGELKTPTIFYHPPDKDQKAKIVRSMIQHLKIPKKTPKTNT